MKIDQDLCTACQSCVPYCPMGAIVERNDQIVIDDDECVECEICQRAGVCATDALFMEELAWPRVLRSQFSNPLITHPDTQVPGRGTEEMKTNDVTGRFKPGRAGMAAELGRPGLGSRFRDVEKVAMAVARLGVTFEPHNPVTFLMTDKLTGKLREDVLDEKVLSAIVEFEIQVDRVDQALLALKEAAAQIDTVFSVDLASRTAGDQSHPAAVKARAAGLCPSENGKTCVGLGRPLFREGEQS